MSDNRHAIGVALSLVTTFVLWGLLSLHWDATLDSDVALYPLMSLEVLRGNHFIYTVGQSHGGTPWVYVRALLFQLFTPTPTLNVLVIGFGMAITNTLWTSLAFRLGGNVSGFAFALVSAFCSQMFAQYSQTDYYMLGLMIGGAVLYWGVFLAETKTTSRWHFLVAGLLLGLGYYVARFTLVYALGAVLLFWARAGVVDRALVMPIKEEYTSRAGAAKRWLPRTLTRVLTLAVAGSVTCGIIAFFTEDRFFGINAEATLKISIYFLAALWINLRGQVLLENPIRILALIAGGAIGLLPHLYFKALAPQAVDRSTNLVRFSEIWALRHEILSRIARFAGGSAHPNLALLAFFSSTIAVLVLILLWKKAQVSRREAKTIGAVSLLFAFCFAAWLCIRTYMHMVPQYLYPAVYPGLLLLVLACAKIARVPLGRMLVAALILPSLLVSLADLRYVLKTTNLRDDTELFKTLYEWNPDVVVGSYWNTYDLMWAQYAVKERAKTRIVFQPVPDSEAKFKTFEKNWPGSNRIVAIVKDRETFPAPRILEVMKKNEIRLFSKSGYQVRR